MASRSRRVGCAVPKSRRGFDEVLEYRGRDVDAPGVLAQSATKPKPAPVPVPAPAAIPAPPLVVPAAIDSALKSLVDSKQIVGASALVYERGQEAYFGAFGLADRENNKPFARDTVVQIFSMTKPVTGVALMQLYERGKFELDAPLAVYAPEFAEMQVYAGVDANGQPKYEAPKRPITVRDILRHTAGFNGDGAPEAVTALYRQADPRNPNNALPEVIAKMAKVPLAYQPGTQWIVQRCRRRAGLPGAEDLRRSVRRVPEAAHLPPARHDAARGTRSCPPIPIARSSPRCTRATTTAPSRASRMRRPTATTAPPGPTSPAAPASSPRSMTT